MYTLDVYISVIYSFGSFWFLSASCDLWPQLWYFSTILGLYFIPLHGPMLNAGGNFFIRIHLCCNLLGHFACAWCMIGRDWISAHLYELLTVEFPLYHGLFVSVSGTWSCKLLSLFRVTSSYIRNRSFTLFLVYNVKFRPAVPIALVATINLLPLVIFSSFSCSLELILIILIHLTLTCTYTIINIP